MIFFLFVFSEVKESKLANIFSKWLIVFWCQNYRKIDKISTRGGGKDRRQVASTLMALRCNITSGALSNSNVHNVWISSLWVVCVWARARSCMCVFVCVCKCLWIGSLSLELLMENLSCVQMTASSLAARTRGWEGGALAHTHTHKCTCAHARSITRSHTFPCALPLPQSHNASWEPLWKPETTAVGKGHKQRERGGGRER